MDELGLDPPAQGEDGVSLSLSPGDEASVPDVVWDAHTSEMSP